ncbi:MAG: HAMP domain-containing histidine kinase [Chloroflexi bacterium]|nr:HAMP domain-containing histidine kinase [Chloroflexota bacterium]MCC6891196.1 HAMP domain-containing histidine kinase [Anaerolineae bacterium]
MKPILKALSILIVNPNPDFIYQLTSDGKYSASHTTFAANATDARIILQSDRPQVIIANDDCDKIPKLFREILSVFTPRERPLLVIVTDAPFAELFEVSDQIVARSQLPYIWQIIEALLLRGDKANTFEKRCVELESENKLLRDELFQVGKTAREISMIKQAVVHSVSHELRTPMLQVKSAVALLKEDEGANRLIVDLAMGAITRLEGGIRNVTLLNELMSETLDTEAFEPTLVLHILEAALRNLGKSWEHKEAITRVKIDVNPTNASVLCDRQRIIVALQLLLDNAIKFSKDEVTVRATTEGQKVHITVQDYGIGIPQKHLEQIFEAFYQVDGSSTRSYGGMGIGLAIVRLIMEQHHTTVEINSVPEKGSQFTFSLSTPDYTNFNNVDAD